MHTIKNLFLLVVLLSPAALSAQSTKQNAPIASRVLYADGPVSYRTSARSPWVPIGPASQNPALAAAYTIKLNEQSILVLEQPGKAPVVIRNRPGEFTVTTLLQSSASDGVGLALADYFRYLWRNLTHHHETIDSYAQGYMKRKGVVSRGCTTPLMLTPDYGAVLATDTSMQFAWKHDPTARRYTLAIYDNYDEKANTLFTTETADTTLAFALDKPFIEKEVTYYWSVYPVGKPNCARYTFSLPKPDALRTLETKLVALDQEMQSSAALAAFVRATLYEGNRFYPEAYRAYFQAYRLAPANVLFRDGLALFLARRGMTQQAHALLASR
ncbi:hypothetical protein GGR92_002384 [Spirosoma lacussanchae]|uniref:hypothetical protein n=1 Tax=Spirosoma lacussanchae TaxID=1884249 RepID=UPI001108B346|nr:hypothetical protein [Spirosoma lacussanchae]